MGSPASSLEGRRRTQFAGGPYAKRVVEVDVLAGLEPGLFEQRERLGPIPEGFCSAGLNS